MKTNTTNSTTVLSRWMRFLGAMLTLALMMPAVAVSQPWGNPVPVALGTAGNYKALANNLLTVGATCTVTGNVGGGTLTLLGSVTGTQDIGNSPWSTAEADLGTVKNNLFLRTADATPGPELGGMNLGRGVYTLGTMQITGTLTLTGTASDIFIFNTTSTLITSSACVVNLVGVLPSNVYWQVGSAATIDGDFKGNILATTYITQNGGTIDGRALAQTAVTLNGASVSLTGGSSAVSIDSVGTVDTTSIQLQNVALGSQTATALGTIKLRVTPTVASDSIVISLPGTFAFSNAGTDSAIVAVTGHGNTFLGKAGGFAGRLVLRFTAAVATTDTVTITGAKMLPITATASNAGTTIALITAELVDAGAVQATSARLKGLRLLPGATTKLIWSTPLTGTAVAGVHTGLVTAVLDLQDFNNNLTTDKTSTVTLDAVYDGTGSTAAGTVLNTTKTIATNGGQYTYANLAYTLVGSFRIRATSSGLTTGVPAIGTSFTITSNVPKNVTVTAPTTAGVNTAITVEVAALDTFFNVCTTQPFTRIEQATGATGAFTNGTTVDALAAPVTIGAGLINGLLNADGSSKVNFTTSTTSGDITIKVFVQRAGSGTDTVYTTTKTITVTPGVAATLSPSPGDTTVAVTTTSNFRVKVQDSYGNQLTTVTAGAITAAAKKGTIGTITVSGSILLVPYTATTLRDVRDTITFTLVSNSFQIVSYTTTRSGPPTTITFYEVGGDSTIVASRAVNSVTLQAKAKDGQGNLVNGSKYKLKFSIVTAGASGSWRSGARGASAVKDTNSAVIADSIVSFTFYSDTVAMAAAQVGALYDTTQTYASATAKASLNMKVNPTDSSKVTNTLSVATPPIGLPVTITSQLKDMFGNNVTAHDSGTIDYTLLSGHGTLAAATTRKKTTAGTVQIVYNTYTVTADTAKVRTVVRGNAAIFDTVTIISIPTGPVKNFLVEIATADANKNAGDSVNITVTARDSLLHRVYTYVAAGQSFTLNNTTVAPNITKDTTFYFSYSDKNGKYVKRSRGGTAATGIADTLFVQGQATITLRKFTAETTTNTVTVGAAAGTITGTSVNGSKFIPLTSVGQTTWSVTTRDTVLINTPFNYTITPRDMYYNVNTTQQNFAQVSANQGATFNEGGNPKIFTGPVTYTGIQSVITNSLIIYVSNVAGTVLNGQSKAIIARPNVSVGPSIDLPTAYALSQNYPNPFNPTTNIMFDIPQNSSVNIAIYDMLGREVATLVNTNYTPGHYTVPFNASKLASGMYMYRMTSQSLTGDQKLVTMTKKLLLVK